MNDKFLEWKKTIRTAGDLAIIRPIVVSKPDGLELHTFVDASEEAFAACVYARSRHGNAYIVRLVAAKARVAPIKVHVGERTDGHQELSV